MATNADLMARPLAPVAQLAAWLLRDGRDVAAILAHLEAWASRFGEVVALYLIRQGFQKGIQQGVVTNAVSVDEVLSAG